MTENMTPPEPILSTPDVDIPIPSTPDVKVAPTSGVNVLLVIVLLVSLGLAGFMWWQNQQLQKQIAEIKQGEEHKTTENTAIPTITPDPTEGWKTYTDSESGISFKYPTDWLILDPEKEVKPQTLTVSLEKGTVDEILAKKGLGKTITHPQKINDRDVLRWSSVGVYGFESGLINLDSNSYMYIEAAIGLSSEGQVSQNDVRLFNQILSTFEFNDSTEPTVKPVTITIPSEWKKQTITDPLYGLTTSLTLPAELIFEFNGSETMIQNPDQNENWQYVTSLSLDNDGRVINTYKGESRRSWYKSLLENGNDTLKGYGYAVIKSVKEVSAGNGKTYLAITFDWTGGAETHYLSVANNIVHIFRPMPGSNISGTSSFSKNITAIISTLTSTTSKFQ